MPNTDTTQLLPKIVAKYPNMAVLMLTMHGDSKHIQQMVAAGAKGYVLKNNGGREVVKALKTILRGDDYHSEEVTRTIMQSLRNTEGTNDSNIARIQDITSREREVLRWVAAALRDKEIADKLHIGIKTVGTHKRNLMKKLGVSSAVGLATFAVRTGLDQPPAED